MVRKAVISSCLLVEGQLHQNLKCLAMLIEIEEAILLKGRVLMIFVHVQINKHANRKYIGNSPRAHLISKYVQLKCTAYSYVQYTVTHVSSN